MTGLWFAFNLQGRLLDIFDYFVGPGLQEGLAPHASLDFNNIGLRVQEGFAPHASFFF